MKFTRRLGFSFLLFILITNLSAQYKAGVLFFDKKEYFNAIPFLKKAGIKNDLHKQDALIKLGECYYFLKEYKNAAAAYQQAESVGELPDSILYRYGAVLKSSSQYDKALLVFKKYIQKHPNEPKAINAMRSCLEINIWQKKPKEYDVQALESINSKKSEFCPVMYEDKIVFVSEQNHDILNYNQFDYDGKPYLNIYLTKLNDKKTSLIHGFSKRTNSFYHDGPVCFSKDFKTLYMTRVNYEVHKKDKNFINRAKIYSSHHKTGHWTKLEEFPYNSDNYSVAHPSLSSDGQFLFFCSDMPGGFGGKDIYMSKWNGNSWDKPVNLGADINTNGDEEFPSITSKGVLYFSSDGLPGFGAMDIFSANNIEGKWILNRNEGLGINSFADDFGIYFVTDTTGYLSSNRDGGKGSDDIYHFTFKSRYISLDGVVLKSQDINDPAPNLKLLLMDKDGKIIASTFTNEKGEFLFNNLETNKNYSVKIDESDPGFGGLKRYYFAEKSNGLVSRVTVVNENGQKFVFKNLPVDPNALPQLESMDDINIAGNLLKGDNTSTPIANTKILLKDSNGNLLDETTTNAFGAFVFANIPPDGSYTIELAESDASITEGTKIILTNKSGKEIKTLIADKNGRFGFKLLKGENTELKEMIVEDADLLMNFIAQLLDDEKHPLANIKVFLNNEKGLATESTLTDKDGKFEFKKLLGNQNYLITIDDSDPNLAKFKKLYIADIKGNIIRELVRKNNKFNYHLLKGEENQLTDMYVDDPWLAVLDLKNKTQKQAITIVENVYYALGDYRFDKAGKLVLDKVIKIMQDNPDITIELSSHTDSRADDNFNLKLSQKRAKTAVEYMISKGISNKRLTAIGLGETKLLNKCGNKDECPEEEHAKNRRTEFKVNQISK